MNKILFWIRNLLSILVLVLVVLYSNNFIFKNILFISLYVIYILVTLKDIIRKSKINDDKLYNIISVLVLFIISFVFLRVFFDNGFIHNSNYYMDIIKTIDGQYHTYQEQVKFMAIMFVDQNMLWFNISLILLLLYRFINVSKVKKEYYSTSLILMILSIISIIPSIYTITQISPAGKYLNAAFSLCYLIITLILVGIEIFRFIQGKYKDKMKLLYVTLFFNFFGIIACAIQLHYTFKFWA